MRLRDIKRRHDARTVRLARLMAMYSSRHEEWFVEDWAFEDIPCPYCFDDGMDSAKPRLRDLWNRREG